TLRKAVGTLRIRRRRAIGQVTRSPIARTDPTLSTSARSGRSGSAHRRRRARVVRGKSAGTDRRARAGGRARRRSLARDGGAVEPASVPLAPRDGLAPVGIPDRQTAAHLVHDSLGRTIARVAIPAVASSLLMTLFASVDAFWVGTRLGSDGLAAVSTSLFWIWMMIALAEMIGVGLTAVAARRHGE